MKGKLSDNEIIKGLECCTNEDNPLTACKDCAYKKYKRIDGCYGHLLKDALDLINRQKAEGERLRGEIESLNKKYPCTVDVGNNCLVYARSLDDYDNLIGNISAEGIKELAERFEYFVLHEDPEINELKCKDYESYMGGVNQLRLQIVKGINNLVKEMVGDAE